MTPSCSERPKICKTLISPTCKTSRCFHTRNASYFQTNHWLTSFCDMRLGNTGASMLNYQSQLTSNGLTCVLIAHWTYQVANALRPTHGENSEAVPAQYWPQKQKEMWTASNCWYITPHHRFLNCENGEVTYVLTSITLLGILCVSAFLWSSAEDLEILRIQQPNSLRLKWSVHLWLQELFRAGLGNSSEKLLAPAFCVAPTASL